jgi:ABC-type branched-subunit amino acid transport system ATPase component
VSTELLAVRDVRAGYLPDLDILQGVQLHVGQGEIIAVIGPNGAGKSTLIKTVVGLLHPRSGVIEFEGRDISRSAPHRLVRHGISYVPQRNNVFPNMTVETNLELGCFHKPKHEQRKGIDQAYDLFPRLRERRRQVAGSLSGGERQMLAIGRALAATPSLLVLDEPSAGLSPSFTDTIFDLIGRIGDRGITTLIVEQNARRVLAVATRGYVLDAGQTRYEGGGGELLNDPNVGALYLGAGSRIDSVEAHAGN